MSNYRKLVLAALTRAYPNEINLDQIIANTAKFAPLSIDDARSGLDALCLEGAARCSNVQSPGGPYWQLTTAPAARVLLDDDPVNHPAHYTEHPSGVECITITEHMGFCLGNAVKYIWRADLKGNAVEDLEKARWYLDREIARRAEQ